MAKDTPRLPIALVTRHRPSPLRQIYRPLEHILFNNTRL
jgi:hypothetical protein